MRVHTSVRVVIVAGFLSACASGTGDSERFASLPSVAAVSPSGSEPLPSLEPPEPWPTGIIDDSEVPPRSGLVGENRWVGRVGGEQIAVFAGASERHPRQGLLIMLIQAPDYNVRFDEYLTPRASGSVRVIRADGLRLILESETGDTFTFDVENREFV